MSKFKRIKKMPPFVTGLLAMATKGLSVTLRTEAVDPSGFLTTNPIDPCILAVWHNRLLCVPGSFPKWMRPYSAVLVSQSRDGGYIADFLKHYGLTTVRGSSSKGGAGALREMQQFLDGGGLLAVTPDGPRGPRYEAHSGICWLASRVGVPIRPASLNTRWHKSLKNWDATQIPLPFSKAQFVIGDPITLDKDLEGDALEAARKLVTEKMMAITDWD